MPEPRRNDPEQMRRIRESTERQIRKYESTGGSGVFTAGTPIVVITSTGAKSGEPRKFAVIRVEHGGEYAVVASIGGMPRNPAWYHNLVAHPTAQLQDGDTVRSYTVREVSRDEKAQWWARAVRVFPQYGQYQTKTDRDIPLFVFSPEE